MILLVPLATAVNRAAYKRLRPWFLEADTSSGTKKKVYDIISLFATLLTMHYFVIPFQALSWEHSFQALKNLKFAGHIILVLSYIIFSLIPVRRFPKKTD